MLSFFRNLKSAFLNREQNLNIWKNKSHFKWNGTLLVFYLNTRIVNDIEKKIKEGKETFPELLTKRQTLLALTSTMILILTVIPHVSSYDSSL